MNISTMFLLLRNSSDCCLFAFASLPHMSIISGFFASSMSSSELILLHDLCCQRKFRYIFYLHPSTAPPSNNRPSSVQNKWNKVFSEFAIALVAFARITIAARTDLKHPSVFSFVVFNYIVQHFIIDPNCRSYPPIFQIDITSMLFFVSASSDKHLSCFFAWARCPCPIKSIRFRRAKYSPPFSIRWSEGS